MTWRGIVSSTSPGVLTTLHKKSKHKVSALATFRLPAQAQPGTCVDVLLARDQRPSVPFSQLCLSYSLSEYFLASCFSVLIVQISEAVYHTSENPKK
jgi:hypothetical protein